MRRRATDWWLCQERGEELEEGESLLLIFLFTPQPLFFLLKHLSAFLVPAVRLMLVRPVSDRRLRFVIIICYRFAPLWHILAAHVAQLH